MFGATDLRIYINNKIQQFLWLASIEWSGPKKELSFFPHISHNFDAFEIKIQQKKAPLL
jgi:hypothetical protein